MENGFPEDGFAHLDDAANVAANVAKYIAKRQPVRLANALKDCKDWVDQEVELGRDRGEVLAELLAKVSDHCRFT